MCGGVARIWGPTSRRRSGNVEARSDKFFLNSRYGKRASVSAPEQPAGWMPDTELDEEQQQHGLRPRVNSDVLVCQYTGAQDLFRCFDAATATRSEIPTAISSSGGAISSSGSSSNSRVEATSTVNDSDQN
ncbi:hypothetical protein B566_EDAN010535 [Ephemera danica]|nr:hypothetical protein B566_EDAN010535 [Ephemera danica]